MTIRNNEEYEFCLPLGNSKKMTKFNKGRSTLEQKVPKITVRWRLKYQNS